MFTFDTWEVGASTTWNGSEAVQTWAAHTAESVQQTDRLPSPQDLCSPSSLSTASTKLVSAFTHLVLQKKKKISGTKSCTISVSTITLIEILSLVKDSPNESPKLLQLWNIFIKKKKRERKIKDHKWEFFFKLGELY